MKPDVNVLLAASRSDHPHHAVARAWLEGALAAAESGAAFTLMPMVLASELRLVTSPKIFQMPTPIADAVAFVDAILAMPGVQLATAGPEWPKLRQLCLDKQLRGNDIPMLGCRPPWSTAANTSRVSIVTSESCCRGRGLRFWSRDDQVRCGGCWPSAALAVSSPRLARRRAKRC
jgi:toxin-antitoxin system PIN domain toxin